MRRSVYAGFTLIELLVTISIVAILALIAVPSFVNFIKYHRITGAADNLYFALQYARSEAIKRNTNVYVSFVTGSSWCYGINTGAACTCTVAGNCNLGTTSAEVSNQITLTTTGLTSNSFFFEGVHGSASMTSGTVTLRIENQTPLITTTIGKMGSIKVCSTGIGGYTAC